MSNLSKNLPFLGESWQNFQNAHGTRENLRWNFEYRHYIGGHWVWTLVKHGVIGQGVFWQADDIDRHFSAWEISFYVWWDIAEVKLFFTKMLYSIHKSSICFIHLFWYFQNSVLPDLNNFTYQKEKVKWWIIKLKNK